jgi:hypothetical protein
MAKQSFVTGQVLTAAQLTSLQQTAMSGGAASAKTASYTLVAADAGTAISMTSTSATTITVNTGLFAAGDTVFIQNLGSGVSTITAGTATVNTSASLALAQYEGGTLYFTSASASLFFKADGAAPAGGGKVLQVVYGSTLTSAISSSTTFADTGLSASITPSSATSKVLVLFNQQDCNKTPGDIGTGIKTRIMRGATAILDAVSMNGAYTGASNRNTISIGGSYLDSPSTTSATTYKTQFASTVSGQNVYVQYNGDANSTIILMEIGA